MPPPIMAATTVSVHLRIMVRRSSGFPWPPLIVTRRRRPNHGRTIGRPADETCDSMAFG
jgi:hypothetical protein